MPHSAFDLQWNEAMTELMEQVQIEMMPGEVGESGQPEISTWTPLRTFQHYACLYIKYIDIFRKLEECYDQIVHPQKRILLRTILEANIIRMCELRETLVFFNPRAKSIYINLDDILMDLKTDPRELEIPIPRYFLEDNRRDMERRKQLIDKLLIQFFGSDEPEEDEIEDPYYLDLNLDTALRCIQKNERGRQGRARVISVLNIFKEKARAEEKKNKLARAEYVPDDQEGESAQIMQQVFRTFLSRVFVHQKRQSELEFLGMEMPELDDDSVQRREKVMADRRTKRIEYQNELEADAIRLKGLIDRNEGREIKEAMLEDRQKWIVEHMERSEGKLPTLVEDFYKRDELNKVLTSEEEAKKKLEEEEAAQKAKDDKKKKKDKKGKEGKKEKGKKGKKGKKKEEDGDKGDKNSKWFGPSPMTIQFQTGVSKYKEEWETKDESDNPLQKYDAELAKTVIRPEIMETIRKQVDEIITGDLENLKIALEGGKVRKGKKGKGKGKKGKGKKGKGKKGKKKKAKDGERKCPYKPPKGGRRPDEDYVAELVEKGIIRKVVEARVSDFLGSYNYLGSVMQHKLELKDMEPEPSYAQVRQLVTELAILPMGTQNIRKNVQTPCRRLLLYGPAGCGKTLLARAIAYHTNSMFIDLSPFTVERYLGDSKGLNALTNLAFYISHTFEPAVIYLDECETLFPGKKGKKKGKSKGAKGPNFTKMKKELVKLIKKVSVEYRVLIVGCTSKPWEASLPDLKKMFEKHIYIPAPNYMTRKELWEHVLLTKEKLTVNSEFHFSTLAQLSEGYTAGSILNVVRKVLTENRKSSLRLRPLTVSEFLPALSKVTWVSQQENSEYKRITYDLIGMKGRYDAEVKRKEEEEGEGKGKAKGKGGKKGKK